MVHMQHVLAIYTLIGLPPPHHLPPRPHTSTGAFSRVPIILKVHTIRFKAALVPDGHIACPRVAEPHSSPRSIFFMYTCYMDILYTC